jgi:hypothetical protein
MSDPDSRSIPRLPHRSNPLLLAQRHGATPIPPSLQAKMAAVCLAFHLDLTPLIHLF